MTALARINVARSAIRGWHGFLRRLIAAIGASFIEARPQVQVLLVLRLLVGNVLGHASGASVVGTVVLSDVSWLLASWSVYVVNGLSDRVGDRRNGSHRPLASGRLSMRAAIGSVIVLSAGSLCLAVGLGPVAVLMVSAFLALGAAYSVGPWPLKNRATTASLTVGLAGAATYVFGALAVLGGVSEQVVIVAVAMGAWMLVAGNAKDFGDETGDRLAGRQTLPLVLGKRRAELVLSCAVLAVGFSVTAASMVVQGVPGLALLSIGATGMALMWRSASAARRGTRSAYRVFMWSQFAVNLALICT